jgi:hypothetical protein
MIMNSNENDKVIAFSKYASFLSNKFGVKVVFDGTNAHTDGNTITLPNIIGMSEEELDFLYCVLLHEVGHIKYSDFSKEAFKKIRSENHFLLVNSIEDARIENKLIDEFGGAYDIFDRLYNYYTSNEKFMSRVFGFSGKNSNELMVLGSYIHGSLIKIKMVSSKEKLFGKATLKKVEKFVDETGLDSIIRSHRLENWDDVITLSEKIYDLFYNKKNDKSDKNDLIDKEKTITENSDLISSMLSKEEAHQKLISDLKEQLKSKSSELQNATNNSRSDVETLKSEIAKNQEKIDQLSDLLYDKEDLKDLNERKNKIESNLSKKEEQINRLVEKINKATEKKGLNEEKKAERITKYNDRIKALSDSIQKNKSDLQESVNEISELSNKIRPEDSTKTQEEIESELKALYDTQEALFIKNEEAMAPIESIASKIKELNYKIKEEKQKINQELVRATIQLQKEMEEAGLPVGAIPLPAESGWEDENGVQARFDEIASISTGSLVRNGKALSRSGTRDIVSILEKAKNDLESIDLAKIFIAENSISRLSSEIKSTPDLLDDLPLAKATNRVHVPVSTQFDIVKTENISDGKVLSEIKTKNALELKRAKEVINNKLKYKKKNKFNPNKEEGQLDQRSLWKLASKTDSNFFESISNKFSNEVVGSIAVDLSGSMDADESRSDLVRSIATLISEGLTSSHIKHEIIGFHAPVSENLKSINGSNLSYNRLNNNLETVVFKKFNDPRNSGIQNIESHCTDNSDGESLKLIGTRIKRERAKRRIIFLISDCRPYLSGADLSVLDQDLVNTISSLKKDKIELVVFSFDEFGKAFYGENLCVVNKLDDVIDFLKKKL